MREEREVWMEREGIEGRRERGSERKGLWEGRGREKGTGERIKRWVGRKERCGWVMNTKWEERMGRTAIKGRRLSERESRANIERGRVVAGR